MWSLGEEQGKFWGGRLPSPRSPREVWGPGFTLESIPHPCRLSRLTCPLKPVWCEPLLP